MTQVIPEVKAPNMGITKAPLNSMVPNLALSTSNGGTSGRHTLTVSTAATINIDLGCSTVLFKPANIPTAPIFIKFGNATTITTASATNFDEVLTEADPCFQLGTMDNIDRYSIFSSTSQTVYTIERN